MRDLLQQNLNPQRLGTFLSIGLFLAAVLSTRDPTTAYLPITRSDYGDIGLLFAFIVGVTLLLNQSFAWGRFLISLSLSVYGLLLLNHSLRSPSQSFVLMVGYSLALFFLWRLEREDYLPPCDRCNFYEQLNINAAFGWAAIWVYVFMFAEKVSWVAHAEILLGASCLLAFVLRFARLSSEASQRRIAIYSLVGFVAAAAYVVFSEHEMLEKLARASLFVPFVALGSSLPLREFRNRFNTSMESMFFHPEGAVLITFSGLCLFGSILLNLPGHAQPKFELSWLDAAFTAVSAVCVTGLVTVDIASSFSLLGQASILLLIQLGGLGIMSLSSLALLFVGERLSVRQETALASTFGQRIRGEIRGLVHRIVWVTLVLELIGTLILTLLFKSYDLTWGAALWQGLFTAISAFCNAGFFLHSQGLIPYNQNPLLLHTVGLLIIFGGISPAYVYALLYQRKFKFMTLQFKFVTLATVGLLLFGTLMFALIEWNQSLALLPWADKLQNAWFLSVTTRTAGFNPIDMTLLTPASLVIMMFLMFIGGSPGGTAGGIKTTSFMVMAFAVISVVRGRTEVDAFSRRIPHDTIIRATAVTILGLAVGAFFYTTLLLTQKIEPYALLFEVISALGTVGLSVGATLELDGLGKILIMACMFLGRVGPLSVFLFFGQSQQRRNFSVPEESVVVS